MLHKTLLVCHLLSVSSFRQMKFSSSGGHCFVSLEDEGNFLWYLGHVFFVTPVKILPPSVPIRIV